jgi:RimJ/RimL family protein N-acetyltransferase
MPNLETQRLRFVPFSPELLKAASSDKARLAQMLGAAIPDSWPGPDLAEALPSFADHLEQTSASWGWDGFIIHKADGVLIGDIGLMGGPNTEGVAEIGYSIVPEYRDHGYATEMARALIAWAFQQDGLSVITAKTRQDNLASINVLTRVGMRRLGVEGDMLTWELRKEA